MNLIEDESVPVQTAAEIIADEVLTPILKEQHTNQSTNADTEHLRRNRASTRTTRTELPPSSNGSRRAEGLNSSNIVHDLDESNNDRGLSNLYHACKTIDYDSEKDDEYDPECSAGNDKKSDWVPSDEGEVLLSGILRNFHSRTCCP